MWSLKIPTAAIFVLDICVFKIPGSRFRTSLYQTCAWDLWGPLMWDLSRLWIEISGVLSTPSPPIKSFPTKSPWVKLSGRLPIKLYGHENSHPLKLRVCLSQTLWNQTLSRRTGRMPFVMSASTWTSRGTFCSAGMSKVGRKSCPGAFGH